MTKYKILPFLNMWVHTALAHKFHKAQCGCVLNKQDVKYVCRRCGAAYDNDPLYMDFGCYDCGRRIDAIHHSVGSFNIVWRKGRIKGKRHYLDSLQKTNV